VRRVSLVLVSLLTAACATARPHPPIGVMWGYLGTAANLPGVEILGYAPDRPSCEFMRAMAQTRSGVPVPSQVSAQCQELAVLPYRDGADPIYWVFTLTEGDVEQFAAGGNDRDFCTNFRQETLKVFLRRRDSLTECEPVIVKRVM
jgi:hypothetical protein